MSADTTVPELYVEGADDISIISALLSRHGIDTARGDKVLRIKSLKSIDAVLANMPDAIRASTERPVGFVLDIDVNLASRWERVCGRIRELGITPPESCPHAGYFDRYPGYPHRFAVWLMPDCATDDGKMEHLILSLMRADDPLWPFACDCVSNASEIIDEINEQLPADGDHHRYGFRNVDRIKADVHTWLAWQRNPGVQLGAAINDHILGHDSPQALAFLHWLKDLYRLDQLGIV